MISKIFDKDGDGKLNEEERKAADEAVRQLVSDLFLNETDAIRLVKYKEIYETLETATDRCEDVADILQTIVVKNS